MPYVHETSIIKIAYADGDLTLQDFLPGFIDSIENCKVIIQAYTGLQLLQKLSNKPDTNLIVSDIVLPELDGIDMAKKVKREFPETKVLFISSFKTDIVYSRVLQAQGNGFIPKDKGRDEIKRGILEVMKTGFYFPNIPALMKQYFLIANEKKRRNKFLLSDQEITFLKLICTNLTYIGIADKMKCTTRHVDYIRKEIFEKFEVHSKAEMVSIAKESGLVI
jgi:DNA-binding NarL/FixJ family response regulator